MIKGARAGDLVRLAPKFGGSVTTSGHKWDTADGDTGMVVKVIRSGGYVFVYVRPDHMDYTFVVGPRDLQRC